MAFHSPAFFLFLLTAIPLLSHAEIAEEVAVKIKLINAKGKHYGLLVSSEAELKVVLDQGWFHPDEDLPSLDISGRRFYVGEVEGCRTILAMTGTGSVNAAQTTQLLLTHFSVRAVIHNGRAASAKPNDLSIGDIAVPSQFAHTGVWYCEPETVYSVKGKPEVGKSKFWFLVDDKLLATAKEIEGMDLAQSVGKSLMVKIKRVEKGV
ncbi:bark storage protein A-like [Cryptomeria japonica]|uniref:bark storage protein A-like n=1 Tax=Cryptomeria japonica TaxID=3369 RepID=UPI0027DA7202|nr:bark storage protein A-like [Cryptomeria japonica]